MPPTISTPPSPPVRAEHAHGGDGGTGVEKAREKEREKEREKAQGNKEPDLALINVALHLELHGGIKHKLIYNYSIQSSNKTR